MRAYDNGCFYTVTVSEREVSDFAATWPCAHFPESGVWFQFAKKNGDLVDEKFPGEPYGDAKLALCAIAQLYGKLRLRLG